MDQLPADFADSLARLLEPGQEDRIAEIIESATTLDDQALQRFLEKFAARVRRSPRPIKAQEVLDFLPASKRRGQSPAT